MKYVLFTYIVQRHVPMHCPETWSSAFPEDMFICTVSKHVLRRVTMHNPEICSSALSWDMFICIVRRHFHLRLLGAFSAFVVHVHLHGPRTCSPTLSEDMLWDMVQCIVRRRGHLHCPETGHLHSPEACPFTFVGCTRTLHCPCSFALSGDMFTYSVRRHVLRHVPMHFSEAWSSALSGYTFICVVLIHFYLYFCADACSSCTVRRYVHLSSGGMLNCFVRRCVHLIVQGRGHLHIWRLVRMPCVEASSSALPGDISSALCIHVHQHCPKACSCLVRRNVHLHCPEACSFALSGDMSIWRWNTLPRDMFTCRWNTLSRNIFLYGCNTLFGDMFFCRLNTLSRDMFI